MKPFRRLAIVGAGLIGGSLALALKRKKLARHIIGVCRHEESVRSALDLGVIDSGSTSLDIIKGADCLVIATPVATILSQAQALAKLVGPGCIVTDAGSTKSEIVCRLEKLFPLFVGSHPLAGSEKHGVRSASATLFEKACCIITPTPRTDACALKTVRELWRAAGCSIARMTPARHDAMVASISHAPHIAAFALVNAVPRGDFRFAASGLKDTTRIAGSDEEFWADILLSNRANVAASLRAFEQELSRIKRALKSNDANELKKLINQARHRRQALDDC